MKTTSSSHPRPRRLIPVAAGLLLLSTAGLIAFYFIHQPVPVTLNDSINIMPDAPPEDTSAGKHLQHPITAMALQKRYLANDPETDEKYTNQVVYITGTFIGTGLNPMGTTYMLLKSSDRLHAIKCFLPDNKEINIVKGSPLFIKGYCRGQIWDLKIEDCELLDIPLAATK